LEKESSKIEKTKILAKLFSQCSRKIWKELCFWSKELSIQNTLNLELGIATQLMIRAMSKAYGLSEEKIEEEFAKLGDLGLVAEKLSKNKKQATLFKKSLTVEKVFEELRKLPLLSGEGSQEKKIITIYHLLLMAEPKEAKYLS